MQSEQRAGETIYKGHRSYDLMLNLQLGIRCSVTRVAGEQSQHTLESHHFQSKVGTAASTASQAHHAGPSNLASAA